MGGVCTPPPRAGGHGGRGGRGGRGADADADANADADDGGGLDQRGCAYMVLVVGFWTWLQSNAELLPVLLLGGTLGYYCAITWLVFHGLDLFVGAMLVKLHER